MRLTIFRAPWQVAKLLEFSDNSLDEESLEKDLKGLQDNIETAAKEAATPVMRAMPKKQMEVAKSFGRLEKELKRKTQKLSSEKSISFVDNLTKMIGNCSDVARTEAVLSEFIQNERSLEAAARMLKSVSPDAETSEKILEQLEKIASERKLETGELNTLIKEDIQAKKERKQKRLKKRKSSQLMTRIRHKIKKDFSAMEEQEELLAYLGPVLNKEIKAKAAEEAEKLFEKRQKKAEREDKKQAKTVDDTGERLQAIVSKIDVGIVLVDEEGNVGQSIRNDLMPEFAPGKAVNSELLAVLADLPPDTAVEYNTVQVIQATQKKNGSVDAFLFVPLEGESE